MALRNSTFSAAVFDVRNRLKAKSQASRPPSEMPTHSTVDVRSGGILQDEEMWIRPINARLCGEYLFVPGRIDHHHSVENSVCEVATIFFAVKTQSSNDARTKLAAKNLTLNVRVYIISVVVSYICK